MGSATVIYGSDDDLEDDISNEYEQYREKSMSANSVSLQGSSHTRQPENNSGDRINTAMHEAHAGLFQQDASLNITDQTSYVDLEKLTASASLKRNCTTMEQLSTKSTTYSSKSCLVDVEDQERNDREDSDLNMQAPKKQRRDESNDVHVPVPESKRSDSTNFDMPSSRETHAAGSKDLPHDSPEVFRTQTTVPFSGGTQAFYPTQTITPMVLIPPMPAYDNKSSVEDAAPGSSALLNEQINGIDAWLQDDIEQGRAAQQAAQGIDLPDTDPAQSHVPEINGSIGSDAPNTVDPQALVLGPGIGDDPSNEPEGSNTLPTIEADCTVAKERTKSRKRNRAESAVDEDHEDAIDGKTLNFDPEDDELAKGLPPPEMYKPRPSRSRGRRDAAEPNVVQDESLTRNDASKKKSKRRKTAGETDGVLEPVNANIHALEVENVERSTLGKEIKVKSDKLQNQIEISNNASEPAPRNTIEVGDEAEESDARPEPPAPAPKKKRGRPKKADKHVQKASPDIEETFQKLSGDAEILAKALNDLESNTDPEAKAKKARLGSAKAKQSITVLEDSEDELAASVHHGKTGSEPSVAAERGNTDNSEPGHEVQEHENEDEVKEPVKAPKKRGRKPKSTKAPAKLDLADATNVVKPEIASDRTLETTSASEPESSRIPLKERPDSQNQDLSAIKDAVPSRSASPSKEPAAPATPRQQAGGIAARPSPLTTGNNAVRYRVGLSRKTRIEPLLKTLKR